MKSATDYSKAIRHAMDSTGYRETEMAKAQSKRMPKSERSKHVWGQKRIWSLLEDEIEY